MQTDVLAHYATPLTAYQPAGALVTVPANQLQPCRIHPAVTHEHTARCAACLGPLDHGDRRGCFSSVVPVERRDVRWLCVEGRA